MEQFHQSFGGTCRAQQIAINLAQHRKGTGQQNHIDHSLTEFTRAHGAIAHRQGPLVQAPQQRSAAGQNDEAHQHRARSGAAQRGPHGLLGGCGEALSLPGFGGVALHHRNRVQHLGGHGAGVGHPVLARARQLAHPSTQGHAGPDHQDQQANDLQHQHRVAVDQHQQGACAHHQIAQAHGE